MERGQSGKKGKEGLAKTSADLARLSVESGFTLDKTIETRNVIEIHVRTGNGSEGAPKVVGSVSPDGSALENQLSSLVEDVQELHREVAVLGESARDAESQLRGIKDAEWERDLVIYRHILSISRKRAVALVLAACVIIAAALFIQSCADPSTTGLWYERLLRYCLGDAVAFVVGVPLGLTVFNLQGFIAKRIVNRFGLGETWLDAMAQSEQTGIKPINR